VPKNIVDAARELIDALNFALAIALVVNASVAFALWIVERAFQRVSGRRVEYRVKRK
ncbi:MAG: hypothetical protein HY258_01210, partial [Chloroflexi bacterium]|nr:hypothetical protein [Chloroflexota bacterium]